ncbi:ribosomal RNA small subunit methyltransferase A [Candidatus Micrarchaeota archaeon]|nr:ribosomal RNA small subunit methyltransferase A [Candidatus Micrarchaeota archaeon]
MRQLKRLSQVFLRDISFVQEYLDLADFSDKRVLEIGAGTGVITRYLAEHAKEVTALEVDERLARELANGLRDVKNVNVIMGDARIHPLDAPVIVGFLPYHLSSPLLFRILNSTFQDALLCLQKEFALRMIASPDTPQYARLSVMAQSLSDVEIWGIVPRTAFRPVPRVDSAFVHLVKNPKAHLDPQLVQLLFQHKNQSVKNALWHSRRSLSFPSPSDAKTRIARLPLASRRVRSLTLQEIEKLSITFQEWL